MAMMLMTREFLCQGFTFGFRVPYQGPCICRISRNHISAIHKPLVVRHMINDEIVAGRVRGHFLCPPCEQLICSPLALIPKHEAGIYKMSFRFSVAWRRGTY